MFFINNKTEVAPKHIVKCPVFSTLRARCYLTFVFIYLENVFCAPPENLLQVAHKIRQSKTIKNSIKLWIIAIKTKHKTSHEINKGMKQHKTLKKAIHKTVFRLEVDHQKLKFTSAWVKGNVHGLASKGD